MITKNPTISSATNFTFSRRSFRWFLAFSSSDGGGGGGTDSTIALMGVEARFWLRLVVSLVLSFGLSGLLEYLIGVRNFDESQPRKSESRNQNAEKVLTQERISRKR